MTGRDLIERYSKSHFDAFVPAESVLPKNSRKAAEAEYERDPVRCLLENVEEARDNIRFTKERVDRARRDGLFDADIFDHATKKEKLQLAACMELVRGDYVRAQSELAHWREYVRWATEEQAAKVAKLEAADTERLALPPQDLSP